MNYNDEGEMWDWQGQDCVIEDNIDISKCLVNEDPPPCMLDDATTPVKACGDLGYHGTSDDVMDKEFDQYQEPSSQTKRRRMLQYDSGALGTPIFDDDMFLRSMETQDSLEDAISDVLAAFSEDTSASTDDYLDPSSDCWIADCLNDADMPPGNENISMPGASDVQIDTTGFCNTPNAVENQPAQTPQNIVFKGKKSVIRSPPKLASAVISPFTFIKPCGVLGDMTLKDINQRLHNPPKSKQDECETYTTSAFSGKPVVGKTKIRTEGGEGSITIVRTKG